MKKIVVSEIEILEYQENHQLYASETFNGKRLRLNINLFGEYIVTYGDELLYRGNNVCVAKRAFNHVENVTER